MKLERPIDHEVLNALAAHWMASKLNSDPGNDDLDAGLNASSMVAQAFESQATAAPEEFTDKFCADLDHYAGAGVNCGIRIAVAVLNDPFGNPTKAITAAIDELVESLRQHIEFPSRAA